jgi:prepilin-type N-terminal cleavage/methylation domain-containing protein
VRRRGDDGFTLVETLTSIVLISVVMAGLTSFYLKTTAATWSQSQIQAANQVASASMERVMQLPGDALLTGRPACLVAEQWSPTVAGTPPLPAGVSRYLTTMSPEGDPSLDALACPAGTLLSDLLTSANQLAKEALPTEAVATVKVDGNMLKYTTDYFVGLCWQQRSTPTAPNPDAECVKPTLATSPSTSLSSWAHHCSSA